MRATLTPHRDSSAPEGLCVEVEAMRIGPHRLILTYAVTGSIGNLFIPEPGPIARADDLWRRTCFEAFLAGQGTRYYEFNAAPSSQWAAYHFGDYRAGMQVADEVAEPRIETGMGEGRFELKASFDLGQTFLAAEPSWRLGLSAVMEDGIGSLSYWAMAHLSGPADFHHPASFIAELVTPS